MATLAQPTPDIRELPITQLALREPFIGLFPIRPPIVAKLVEDMKAHGFRRSRPVTAWRTPEGALVLVDGYMRLQAAGRAGLTKVWAECEPFADERAAFEWACAEQGERRRNLTPVEFRKYVALAVKTLDRLKPRGGSRPGHVPTGRPAGRSAEETARKVGTSPTEVKRIRRVQKSGDADAIAKLEAGESPQKLVKQLSPATNEDPEGPSDARADCGLLGRARPPGAARRRLAGAVSPAQDPQRDGRLSNAQNPCGLG
jgi:hypothetical protein